MPSLDCSNCIDCNMDQLLRKQGEPGSSLGGLATPCAWKCERVCVSGQVKGVYLVLLTVSPRVFHRKTRSTNENKDNKKKSRIE